MPIVVEFLHKFCRQGTVHICGEVPQSILQRQLPVKIETIITSQNHSGHIFSMRLAYKSKFRKNGQPYGYVIFLVGVCKPEIAIVVYLEFKTHMHSKKQKTIGNQNLATEGHTPYMLLSHTNSLYNFNFTFEV